MLTTPIAFLFFNRPETTRRVFESIRAVQPSRLLLIGDGPRVSRDGEAEKVAAARQIVNEIDWPCEVETNYSETNLGCKHRVSSGLDWAFERSESLIILEDDCLPHPSFFGYCEQLLDRFANDERIMMISGDNFQPEQHSDHSYYFSRWSHIWGWASWRRAWKHFDVNVSTWPSTKLANELRPVFGSDEEYQHWCGVLDSQHAGEIDTWDFPWQYACWQQRGLTVLPEKNLISNIGFGADATHTTDPLSKLANLPVDDIGELNHPPEVVPNRQADLHTWQHIFCPPKQDLPRKKRWYRRLFSTTQG